MEAQKIRNNRVEENGRMRNLTPYPSTGISYPEFILYVELISYFWAAIFDVMPRYCCRIVAELEKCRSRLSMRVLTERILQPRGTQDQKNASAQIRTFSEHYKVLLTLYAQCRKVFPSYGKVTLITNGIAMHLKCSNFT
jgi:hypothetical protein